MASALVTCRNGMGTSTMMTVQVQDVASKNGWDLDVSHSSLDGVGSFNGDVVIALNDVAADLKKEYPNKKVIGITNMMDANEIEQKLKPIMEC